MIVNFNLTLERVCRNESAKFRPGSTGLDHALVVFDLTQIQVTDNQCVIKTYRSRSKRRSFVSGNSLPIKFKVWYRFDSWSHEQYSKCFSRRYPSNSYETDEDDSDEEPGPDHDYEVQYLSGKKFINKGRWTKGEVGLVLYRQTGLLE